LEPPDLTWALPASLITATTLQLCRQYRLDSMVPIGVIPVLLIMLCEEPTASLQAKWQQGVVVHVASSSTWAAVRAVQQSIFLQIWSAARPEATALLRKICQTIENQLQHFYHVAFEVITLCPRAELLMSGAMAATPTCYFPLDRLREAAFAGREEVLRCLPQQLHPIVIQDYAPDLLLLDLTRQAHLSQFSLEQLPELRELGRGSFGRVYLSQLTLGSTQVQVAVKVLLPREEADSGRVAALLQEFQSEISTMSQIQHPNLLTLYGSVAPPHALAGIHSRRAHGHGPSPIRLPIIPST
jgi:hypothetical protein